MHRQHKQNFVFIISIFLIDNYNLNVFVHDLHSAKAPHFPRLQYDKRLCHLRCQHLVLSGNGLFLLLIIVPWPKLQNHQQLSECQLHLQLSTLITPQRGRKKHRQCIWIRVTADDVWRIRTVRQTWKQPDMHVFR